MSCGKIKISSQLEPAIGQGYLLLTNSSGYPEYESFQEQVDDRVNALLTAGTNITLNYDDVNDSLEISATGGSGETPKESVNQTSHGFVAGDAIRHNGTSFVKAQADSATNAAVVGVVDTVTDANNFDYRYAGVLTSGTWTNGTAYFLSPDTAGSIVTEPTPYANGEVRQFIGMGTPNGLLIEIDVGLEITDTGGFNEVSKNSGASVNAAARSVLNYIEGNGITLTIADDSLQDEVDITIAEASRTKSITIEEPQSTESIVMWRTPHAITVTEIRGVVAGTGSPSVTIDPTFTTDITQQGTKILSGTNNVTSTTGGDGFSTFNDATIPSGNWIMYKNTATSGTVNLVSITIEYTID